MPGYMVQLGTDLYVRPDHVSRVYMCGGRVYIGIASGQSFISDWTVPQVLDALDVHVLETTNETPEEWKND